MAWGVYESSLVVAPPEPKYKPGDWLEIHGHGGLYRQVVRVDSGRVWCYGNDYPENCDYIKLVPAPVKFKYEVGETVYVNGEKLEIKGIYANTDGGEVRACYTLNDCGSAFEDEISLSRFKPGDWLSVGCGFVREVIQVDNEKGIVYCGGNKYSIEEANKFALTHAPTFKFKIGDKVRVDGVYTGVVTGRYTDLNKAKYIIGKTSEVFEDRLVADGDYPFKVGDRIQWRTEGNRLTHGPGTVQSVNENGAMIVKWDIQAKFPGRITDGGLVNDKAFFEPAPPEPVSNFEVRFTVDQDIPNGSTIIIKSNG